MAPKKTRTVAANESRVSDRDAADGQKWAKMRDLRSEGDRLWKESVKIRDKASALYAESERLEDELMGH